MRQKLQPFVLLSATMSALAFVGDPMISLMQPALAATGQYTFSATGPLSGPMQSGATSTPRHRLVSEMPGLKKLAPPPLTRPSPPLPKPAIGVTSTSFSFSARQGDGIPRTQTLTITNIGGGILSWNAAATATAAWLTLSPTSGKDAGTIAITATAGSLPIGTYNTSIAVSAASPTNVTPVSIPVVFTVTAPLPTLTVNPTSLTLTGIQGGKNPAGLAVTVNSNGKWKANSSEAWLTPSPSSGNGNGSIVANVDLSSAVVGVNNATIIVTSGEVAKSIPVSLTVSAASLTASPNSVTYTATQGAANPSDQIIAINSNSSWTVTDGAPWLSLSPTSGSYNGTIRASVNTATAIQGSNSATITVTSGGTTRAVPVTLTLNAPSSSSVTLTWKANKESDLAGYRVYRATASGVYGAPIATIQGNTTSYLAAGLQFGTTYFFVVTAFDIAGNESEFSNEVSKSVF
jgi:hypothetical protein